MNKPTDDHIIVNILIVKDCFLDKSHSFKVDDVSKLPELIKFIEKLKKEI